MSLLFAVLLGIGQVDGGATPTVEELEAGIRKNRELVRFGVLQIKSEGYTYGKNGKLLHEKAVRDIWFDTKRMRVSWIGKTAVYQDRERILHACVPYDSEDNFLYYDNGQSKEIGVKLLILHKSKNHAYNQLIVDPRAIGLYPMAMSIYSNYRLDGLLGVANYKGRVQARQFEGKRAFEIVYDALEERLAKTKTRMRTVVVPSMGYSVPEVEISAVYDGLLYQQILQSEVTRVGKSMIWFPSKIHYKKNENGVLVEDDLSEITKADFDAAPPDSAFRISSMNIPVGTPVDFRHDGKTREWDGVKIVEKAPDPHRFSKQFPDLPPAAASGWSSFWLWLAGGLTVAGGGFLYWAWRRKPA